MATGILYSPGAPRTVAVGRDAFGDLVDADGNVLHGVGGDGIKLSGLVMGGPKWNLAPSRGGDVVSAEGSPVGVPVTAKRLPNHGDTLVIGTVKYRVHGPAQWAEPGGLTGRRNRFVWYAITALAN
ncbi:hypothetical protein [Mycolicibacterium palauense]|uniref:hypothetical protein n=1 Tax=Mycolicibacterium palauense TaxID=2034511 RepID=UPI000BFEC9D8|nr:hypothetical protein [Mycolicibacterium palauense]